jgi:hypothetical protein
MSHDLKDTYRRPCPKCGATNVMWLLNYYYCNKCWLKGEHIQPILSKQVKKPKRKYTKKVKN